MSQILYDEPATVDEQEPVDIPLLGLSPRVIKKAATTSYPSPIIPKEKQLSDEEKIAKIEKYFRQILETLGLDLENDSIAHTSYRIAKMYVKESFSGLDLTKFPSLCFIEDSIAREASQVIVIKDVTLSSYCEHHFVPMNGIAHIAYIPNKKIIGLSKINRIASYFCKRPQLQERLTAQIADSLHTVLASDDIAVFTKMKHHCVSMRGIGDQASYTETYVLKGRFKKDRFYRQEFFSKLS